MTHPIVTIESMKPKLHSLDFARELLAKTEPLSTHGFTVGSGVRFVVSPGWHHGAANLAGTELVEAAIEIGVGPGTQTFQLTLDTLLEAAAISGISRTKALTWPAELLERPLNYFFREGLLNRAGTHDYQLLVAGGYGAALTKANVNAFSNLRLLEQILNGVEEFYGKGEVLVDYKLTHTLKKTVIRLIVPGNTRQIRNTGVADDTWSTGIQLRNSLIGDDKTSIDGYLFRWWCTNGATDTHASSGVWSRKGGREADVYEWARTAVDNVLGGLEPALDAVQNMVDIPIEGHANDVLRDVFEYYRVPVAQRTRIIENMVEAGTRLNMYTVMNAITAAANDTTMDPGQIENLLRMGGDLPYAASSRCDGCRRLMPH